VDPQGIEARRTRNAGRVSRLEALRANAPRAGAPRNVAMTLDAGERSGKLVAELPSQQALRRAQSSSIDSRHASCAAIAWR